MPGNRQGAQPRLLPPLVGGIVALSVALMVCSSPASANSQNSDRQEELFKKVLRAYPVSPDAIKLNFLFSFPQEEALGKDTGLWGARFIEIDEDGNLFISDPRANYILVFDRSGHFSRRIGGKGQGPGEFNSQRGMALDGTSLIVNDTGNRRIQIFNKSGTFISSFVVNKIYPEMAAGHNGMIYAAPIRLQESDPLVDVFNYEGKLQFSFGIGKKHKNWQQLSRMKIAVGHDRLFLAYVCFPILQTYSLRGELKNETNYGRGFMKEQERMNIARDKEGQPGRIGFIEIVQDIKQAQGKAMVLIAHPRVEILELTDEGRVNSSWWTDKVFGYADVAFVVDSGPSIKRFFLLQLDPDNIVRAFEQSR